MIYALSALAYAIGAPVAAWRIGTYLARRDKQQPTSDNTINLTTTQLRELGLPLENQPRKPGNGTTWNSDD